MHTVRYLQTTPPMHAWETGLHDLMTLFALAVVITLCACILYVVLYGLFRMWSYIWQLALYDPKQHK